MAVKFVVEFHGARSTPFTSGAKQVSMRKFTNYLVSLLSGAFRPAGASIKVRNAAVAATGTVTFSGAATAADTVTFNGQALTATQKNATGTASFSTIVAGNKVTIQGIDFTARAAPSGAGEFLVTGGDTAAAAALAAKINAYPSYPIKGLVTATSAAEVVTIRAVTAGTAGNAITLTKTGAPITVSGSGTLTNGAAASNNAWDPGEDAATAGAAFTAAFNASTTSKVSAPAVATHDGAGVVTITVQPGVLGNLCTLTKSGTNIAVVAPSGGSESTPFTFSF